MKTEKCNCFLCRHKNHKNLKRAYLMGLIDADRPILNELKKLGIKPALTSEDVLERFCGCLEYTVDWSKEMLSALGGEI